MSAADIVSKEQCPLCNDEGYDTSEDNLVTFSSGVQHCFRHGVVGKPNKDQLSGNLSDQFPSDILSTVTSKHEDKKMDNLLEITFCDLKNRRISRRTCEFYGYGVNSEKKVHVAQYYDAAGKVKMQQLRTPDKQFPILGDKSYNKTLWGAHKFTPNESVFITITEGQIDALSVAEAFDCKYPVVSLPNGVKSAPEVILHHKKYLEGFKYVVLAFDNDEPGREATERCLKVLEPGKIRVGKWRLKDANDLKVEGKEEEIRKTIWSAVEYIPEPILTGENLLNSLKAYKFETIDWPWDSVREQIQPIRIPAVYTIAAKPGVGKTEFVSEIIKSEIGNCNRVGIIALEQTIPQILIKFTDSLMGSDLGSVVDREFTSEEQELCRHVANHIVIYDHITYGSDLETVISNIPYMVKTLGCQLIIFDNISYSATRLSGKEHEGINKAMVDIKDSTVKYNYTILNVCHVKRDDGLSEETDQIDVERIYGGQGIEKFSDYIIGLSRNKGSEDILRKNTLQGQILKDRFSGKDTGQTFKLYYNQDDKRLEDFKK